MPDMRLPTTLRTIRFTREEAKATGSSRYWGMVCREHPELEGERMACNNRCVKCERAKVHRLQRTPGTATSANYKAKNRTRLHRKQHTPGTAQYQQRKRLNRRRRAPGAPQYVRFRASMRRKRSGGSSAQVVHTLSQRIRCALGGVGTKSARTLELLGCSVEHLRTHLASRFQPGWTWENCGTVWHIDHVRPCASFDLTDPAQQRACFHWTNLQPLAGPENIAKGARWKGKLWSQGKPLPGQLPSPPGGPTLTDCP